MDEMKALSDVFNLRPEMFMQGMRSLENVRQSDQQRLQQQELANQQTTLQNQFATEMNPIKADQARFGLMKDRAMFPGEMATSQGQVRKERDAGNYTPDQIPAVLTQAASFATSPGAQTPALHGAMKSILRNAYIPEIMDNWTPQQFGENLPKMLESYSKLLPKNAAALELQGSKNDAATAREQMKTDRAAMLARLAANAKKSAATAAPKDPAKMEAYYTSLFKQADTLAGPGATEEDLVRSEAVRALANEYLRRKEQADINKSTNINPAIDPTQLLDASGKPRFPSKPIPQPTVDSRVGNAPVAEEVAGRPDRQNKMQYPNAPKIGTAKGGYTYVGGDPAQQSSWTK